RPPLSPYATLFRSLTLPLSVNSQRPVTGCVRYVMCWDRSHARWRELATYDKHIQGGPGARGGEPPWVRIGTAGNQVPGHTPSAPPSPEAIPAPSRGYAGVSGTTATP